MSTNLRFQKTGREIKLAIQKRRAGLVARLEKRNEALKEFLKDSRRVRSYLIRSTEPTYGHGERRGYSLYGKDDISSEEREEIDQLCRRIFEIEQEIYRLDLITAHLKDDQVFNLEFTELIGYGFEV
ncbi:MAG: hypothetical protein HY862_10725 [Chloroflexi bacterium]|nr:hypothetical protein [Chloroflexota bacterium]